jgi:hypothetical protein
LFVAFLAAEVDFLDTFIVLDLIHRAFAKNIALMQDGHLAGQLPYKGHVVFDYKNAVPAFQTQEQLTCFVRFLVGHASRRFVHEQELWVLGQQHSDFKPLLLAVTEGAGLPPRPALEPNRRQHLVNPTAFLLARAMNKRRKHTAGSLQRQQNVLKHRMKNINRRSLKLASNAHPIDLILA